MSKKTITIEVPDGLPDGWECCGYGLPVAGETMHHRHTSDGKCGWVYTADKYDAPVYLIARRVETAADWANKQPKLGALASMAKDGATLEIWADGEHIYSDHTGDSVYIYAESCPESHSGFDIKAQSGKWVNA